MTSPACCVESPIRLRLYSDRSRNIRKAADVTSFVPSIQRPSARCAETRRTAMSVLERPLVFGVHSAAGALVGAMEMACSTSLSTEGPRTSSFWRG